ncbi:MAG: DnaJ domain-containing protein [Deltaproteobacteria bacterium]|nr:DnaJ domain-containing protein [Deltaproteobacteria bacterium]
MNVRAYQELNLRQGASESEIKAAFRKLAKTHHPDTGAGGAANVAKFRSAYQAYSELMGYKVKADGKARQRGPEAQATEAKAAPVSPTPFRFEGQRKLGLDVYLDIALVRPESLGFTIVLPFTAHEACPRCLGQGQTLGRLSPGGDVYRPQSCPKCQGRGSVGRNEFLTVNVTEEMAQRGKFRLRGVGGYLPKQAKRGDLIVSLRWVDSLPVDN